MAPRSRLRAVPMHHCHNRRQGRPRSCLAADARSSYDRTAPRRCSPDRHRHPPRSYRSSQPGPGLRLPPCSWLAPPIHRGPAASLANCGSSKFLRRYGRLLVSAVGPIGSQRPVAACRAVESGHSQPSPSGQYRTFIALDFRSRRSGLSPPVLADRLRLHSSSYLRREGARVRRVRFCRAATPAADRARAPRWADATFLLPRTSNR